MKFPWRRIVLAVILLWIVAVGVLVGSAYGDAKRGRDALQGLQKDTSTAALKSKTVDLELTRASTLLGRAHSKLANPIVAPLRVVPVVGRQLNSAIALTGSGHTVTSTAQSALTRARALTDTAKSDHQGTLAQLGGIAGDASAKLHKVDLGPNRALVGPLARAHTLMSMDVNRITAGLDRASAAANGVAELYLKPANYLVVAANNAEMRSGSGTFLSVGKMQTGGGSLDLGDMRTVGQVEAPKGSITWPPELQGLWGWLGLQNDFRNLMASPRFDVAAPLAAQVWEKSPGGGPVDGVLVLDPGMLRAVLVATGPVQANGKTIDANNVMSELLFEQYKTVDGTPGSNQARREGLSDVASAAFKALDKGEWDPITLAKELGRAGDSRDVMLWSKDTALNDKWKTAGISGELNGNSMMLSLINLGGNKLDQFMKIDATANETTGRSGLDMSVNVKITNASPATGPAYVLGPFPNSGLKKGEYDGMLSFSVPGDATGVRFDGNPALNVAGTDGPTKAIATSIKVMPGETKTMVLRFSRSALARYTTVEPAARVPATTWHYRGQQWVDDHPHDLAH